MTIEQVSSRENVQRSIVRKQRFLWRSTPRRQSTSWRNKWTGNVRHWDKFRPNLLASFVSDKQFYPSRQSFRTEPSSLTNDWSSKSFFDFSFQPIQTANLSKTIKPCRRWTFNKQERSTSKILVLRSDGARYTSCKWNTVERVHRSLLAFFVQVFMAEYAGPLFIYLLFYIRPSIVYGSSSKSSPMELSAKSVHATRKPICCLCSNRQF